MKRTNIMRTTLTMVLLMAVMMAVNAQEGLGVDNVFKRFGHSKGCKMVEMHDTQLRGHELKVYKSLTYKNLASSIEPYLNADRKRAKKIREVMEDGQVVSGYYMMPQEKKGINRYILFSRAHAPRGTVIYIEGELSPDDIMKLCYSRW